MAINLQYVKGKLDKALTRGDGVKGEDCTYAVMKYDNWIRKKNREKWPQMMRTREWFEKMKDAQWKKVFIRYNNNWFSCFCFKRERERMNSTTVWLFLFLIFNRYASKTVPTTLKGNFPEFLEVRGEIVIDQVNFDICNENESEGVLYSSKRNLASGIIHR